MINGSQIFGAAVYTVLGVHLGSTTWPFNEYVLEGGLMCLAYAMVFLSVAGLLFTSNFLIGCLFKIHDYLVNMMKGEGEK